jgi:hypothetical protein
MRERNPHMGEQGPATICGRRYPWMIGPVSSWRRGGIRPWGSRELLPYGGEIPIGTTLSLWRNPPIGQHRAVTMERGKDTYRDNPVTMEERNSLMGEQATAII